MDLTNMLNDRKEFLVRAVMGKSYPTDTNLKCYEELLDGIIELAWEERYLIVCPQCEEPQLYHDILADTGICCYCDESNHVRKSDNETYVMIKGRV